MTLFALSAVVELVRIERNLLVKAMRDEEEAVRRRAVRKRSAFGKSGVGKILGSFDGRSYLSMGVVKDDDSTITWDSTAMAEAAP